MTNDWSSTIGVLGKGEWRLGCLRVSNAMISEDFAWGLSDGTYHLSSLTLAAACEGHGGHAVELRYSIIRRTMGGVSTYKISRTKKKVLAKGAAVFTMKPEDHAYLTHEFCQKRGPQ